MYLERIQFYVIICHFVVTQLKKELKYTLCLLETRPRRPSKFIFYEGPSALRGVLSLTSSEYRKCQEKGRTFLEKT